MKMYATVTSERATKGQGGNEYINIDLMRGSASDSIKCYRLHFTEKALSILKNDKVIFQELVEKGEKQKGEYHKCKKHEERTRECKFYSFQNDPCSEI